MISMPRMITLLAWIPLFWQPTRGQSVGAGVTKTVVKPPDGGTGGNKSGGLDKHGSKEWPFVAGAEGHQQSDSEGTQSRAKEQRARDVEHWTLYFAQLSAWATVALAAIGFSGVLAAIWTLHEIKEQTKTTRDSVIALINSERAWVLVNPNSPAGPLRPLTPGAIRPWNEMPIKITNSGKTVAKIMDLITNSKVIMDTEQLPLVPIYTKEDRLANLGPINGVVSAPGDALDNYPLEIEEWMDEKTIIEIMAGRRNLYVYGLLRYYDFAGVERRNQFCYRYSVRSYQLETLADASGVWILSGPPDYNTHT